MWNDKQIDIIRSSVKAGRMEMKKSGISATIFAEVFIKSGGIQIPGMPDIEEAALRRIGSHVLANIIEGKGPRITPGEPDWFFNAVAREMNRAGSEAYWFSAAKHPNTAGFRLKICHNVIDIDGCKRFVERDNFGLGAGVFPPDEIVVLPPCCDGAYFEVVFKDEL